MSKVIVAEIEVDEKTDIIQIVKAITQGLKENNIDYIGTPKFSEKQKT